MHHQMPSHALDAIRHSRDRRVFRNALKMLYEIESHCTNSTSMVACEFRVRNIGRYDAGAAILVVGSGNSIQSRIHVDAMTAGMNNDGALDAEKVVKLLKCVLACIRGRVGAIRMIW